MSEERTDKELLPEDLMPGEYFPADLLPPGREELLAMLKAYGFEAPGEKIKLMDTSHDAADIRLNYLIDHRFVLRISNGPDLTERRLAELNRDREAVAESIRETGERGAEQGSAAEKEEQVPT